MPELPAPIQPSEAGPPRIVSVGRIHPVKGFDVLIRAAAGLAADRPGLTVEVYGAPQKGHEAHVRALEELAAACGLAGSVRFAGHVQRPWTRWDGAAVYVQASREEPFGIALLEAMAAGLPVVATATDGPTEIIIDGATGLLVPPDDTEALATAIARIVDDRALARALARAGREHVLATYTAASLVAQTSCVYNRALAR
jgi:glycosyltransferase involved in cell wall biosynthesis